MSSSPFNVGMNNELIVSSSDSSLYTHPAPPMNFASPIGFCGFNQMPEPTQAPWTACSMPWTNASTDLPPLSTGVVQFNGQQSTTSVVPQNSSFSIRPVLHKRKADCGASNAFSTSVPKRHITDEQMAQHLSGMHISSHFTSHQQPAESSFGSQQPPTSAQYEPLQPECGKGNIRAYNINKDLQRKLRNAQRITICDEIRRIQSDTLLPESLMHHRIERPCTAIVLWQPPLQNIIGGEDGGTKVQQKPASSKSSDSNKLQGSDDLDNNRPAADELTFEDLDNNNSNNSMEMDL